MIGELSIVNSPLIGRVTEADHIGKFHLLDIDPTCIPSSAGGIVASGKTRQRDVGFARSLGRHKLSEVNTFGSSLGFTTYVAQD